MTIEKIKYDNRYNDHVEKFLANIAEKINEVIDALNRMEAELYLSKEMSDQILKVILEKDHT